MIARRRGGHFVVLVAPALLLAACSTSGRTGEASQPSATPASAQGAPSSSNTSAAGASSLGAPSGPSPRASDPLWISAKDEDPLERVRLAEAVGASGLLLGVADGGEIAETAIAALPYADDAEIALRPLGELALASDPGAMDPLLTAILEIAGRPSRAREPLDPEGARACGEAMITLAGRASLDRALRARAVSAARALAEKGYVDQARVPVDLDPP